MGVRRRSSADDRQRDVEGTRRHWPGARVIHVDYAELGEDDVPGQEDPGQACRLRGQLAEIDAVINAVGIFRERDELLRLEDLQSRVRRNAQREGSTAGSDR